MQIVPGYSYIRFSSRRRAMPTLYEILRRALEDGVISVNQMMEVIRLAAAMVETP